MDALPHWEPGTPGFLIVAGPHAIPVSTAIRRADLRIVLALGRRRETLQRLRDDHNAALALLGRDLAFTAYGQATVLKEELDAAPVTGVEFAVTSIADHLVDGRTRMLDGARWEWTDDEAAGSDPRIRAELATL